MNLDNLQLRGRVAIVTGGSRGIGKAVVELLSELGAHVVVNYLHEQTAADTVVDAARGRGVEALAIQADVADEKEAERLAAATVNRFQRIDILVCNAGIWAGAPVDEMTPALWDRTLDINLKGTWTICHAVVPQMKAQQCGRIVIMTSTAGQRGEANYSNYAASKGGQIALTKSLAAELAPWNITVNAVAPGWVETEMTREALANTDQRKAIAATIPLGKIATPAEIAAPVVFLCTEWSRHITGEILNVNGGSVLCG